MPLKKFLLKDSQIRSVSTEEEVVLRLPTGESMAGTAHGSADHPEFAKLRNRLEKDGYIRAERNWVNGDVVLKGFRLNGMTFSKGEQFPCAAALQTQMAVRLKRKRS